MVSIMAKKKTNGSPKGIIVIGNTTAAVQTALTLAQMGTAVKLLTELASLSSDGSIESLKDRGEDRRFIIPLLLQASKHTHISLFTNTRIDTISGEKGNFIVSFHKQPRYISEEFCTSCGSCLKECSVEITSCFQGQKIKHTAIHVPLLKQKTVPSTYIIEKDEIAPCQTACPLGINIQGFISLIASGKTDQALALINKSAPLAGILGRVCTHPCEEKCNRIQVDNAVYIRALHRYAADNASNSILDQYQTPVKTKEDKIAIVGSGPSGLTAAWALTQRGYRPVVFESHGVIGGMLATGIPRFRLPKEIREREITAILNMGVNIRTGITVGRDVTFTYLKERGYKSFFLAIGTQRDIKLNISGEDLNGVVDCMSLLLTLNLKVDNFAGTNIVVIGGGNAAVDCARAAIRMGAKQVTMIYRRTREEMPAAPEEVTEALDEGVQIQYQSIPIEILGNGSKVTGLRCQKTQLADSISANGKNKPVPISGTEFTFDADHIVVAIGQASTASQLEIEGLGIDRYTGLIKVNPLTLETSIPGVFAGGDCVIGPNNVVEAMADGLRAAESIDRYLNGKNLSGGRSLEKQKTSQVDLDSIEIAPYKRAQMPAISPQKRIRGMEETTTGLPLQSAIREARRCLNCALCSRCLECEIACKVGAVIHGDRGESYEIGAQEILNFIDDQANEKFSEISSIIPKSTDGVTTISISSKSTLADQLTHAMAIAIETAIHDKPKRAKKFLHPEINNKQNNSIESDGMINIPVSKKRIGVFICHCGDSISSAIDCDTVLKTIGNKNNLSYVHQINQACTENGARDITSVAKKHKLDAIVLAGCRCCNIDQICYSCTDRRSLCLKYLDKYLISKSSIYVDFINIREHCAWKYKGNITEATQNAIQMIRAGINRVTYANAPIIREQPILNSVIVIGGSLANLTAVDTLFNRGYQTHLITGTSKARSTKEKNELIRQRIEQLYQKRVPIKSWPDMLAISGSPGNYNVCIQSGSRSEDIRVGALLMDTSEVSKEELLKLTKNTPSGLLGRIISRITNEGFFGSPDTNLLHGSTIKETAGIFLLTSEALRDMQTQIDSGLATAARIATFLEQKNIKHRELAIEIDRELCRGCGDCTTICSFIELTLQDNVVYYASIDKALCMGCGACIASCPTGAIRQPLQSDKQILSTCYAALSSNSVFEDGDK